MIKSRHFPGAIADIYLMDRKTKFILLTAFFVLPFAIIYFSSQVKSNSFAEAMKWCNGDALEFDDWKQIRQDFGMTRKNINDDKWLRYIENEDSVPEEDKKKDFQQLYARAIFRNEAMAETGSNLGIEYPDISWEAYSNGVHFFKLEKILAREKLESYLKKNNYAAQNFRDEKIWTWQKDSDEMARTKDAPYFECVCYLVGHDLLLLSGSERAVKKAIEDHENKKTLYYEKDARKLLSFSSGIESAIIGNGRRFEIPRLIGAYSQRIPQDVMDKILREMPGDLGLSKQQCNELHNFRYFMVAEKKNGESMCNLLFDTKEAAEKDLPLRLRILQFGKSWITHKPLCRNFFHAKAKTKNKILHLTWQSRSYSNSTSQAVFRIDLPCLVYFTEKFE